MTQPKLVVHLTYVLDFGGLETLIVDCINRMPADQYRHAIVCLTRSSPFARRITQPGVEIYELNKAPGWALGTHVEISKLLRRLKPAILHTYNLAAAEYAFTATMAGVPVRVHAEHGRDAADPDGKNWKHKLLRRLLQPCIDSYVAVSADLEQWLVNVVGIPGRKTVLINNGVDTDRYRSHCSTNPECAGQRAEGELVVIGTVGRIQAVKDQAMLIDAFIALRSLMPHALDRLRLVIVGEGPLLPALRSKVETAGLADVISLPGASDDIADLMRTFSIFALSSIAEGMPVTLLEAMATGLPVVSTRVGGIPELILDGANGFLTPPGDAAALAAALARYVSDPELARQHGAAGRECIKQRYSMNAMLSAYVTLYGSLCNAKIGRKDIPAPCTE